MFHLNALSCLWKIIFMNSESRSKVEGPLHAKVTVLSQQPTTDHTSWGGGTVSSSNITAENTDPKASTTWFGQKLWRQFPPLWSCLNFIKISSAISRKDLLHGLNGSLSSWPVKKAHFCNRRKAVLVLSLLKSNSEWMLQSVLLYLQWDLHPHLMLMGIPTVLPVYICVVSLYLFCVLKPVKNVNIIL